MLRRIWRKALREYFNFSWDFEDVIFNSVTRVSGINYGKTTAGILQLVIGRFLKLKCIWKSVLRLRLKHNTHIADYKSHNWVKSHELKRVSKCLNSFANNLMSLADRKKKTQNLHRTHSKTNLLLIEAKVRCRPGLFKYWNSKKLNKKKFNLRFWMKTHGWNLANGRLNQRIHRVSVRGGSGGQSGVW